MYPPEAVKWNHFVDQSSEGRHVTKTKDVPAVGPGARTYRVHVDGECFEVTVEAVGGSPLPAAAAPAPQPLASTAIAAPVAPVVPAPKAAQGAKGTLLAPMPGMVVDVLVKPGDAVKAGDVLVLLEAMKMENGLESPADGVVAEVYFQKGDSVPKDAVLVTIG
jgi:biotin carboxyl carrier protein